MSRAHTNRIHKNPPCDEAASDRLHQVEHCQSAVIDSVRQNPLASTMIAFGVGLGIGTMLGSLLVHPDEQRRQQLARSLGQRMLNSVIDFMPAGLQQHLPT